MGQLAQQLNQVKETQAACSTCTWLADPECPLDAEDRAGIDRWLDEGRPPHTVWRMLKKLGMPTGADAFRQVHCKERHGRAE